MKGHGLNRSGFVFCLVIGMFLFVSPAWAADFCVGTAEELNIALATATSNVQKDTIRVVQGTYNGNFIYSTETEAFGVIIEGGYTAECASRVVDAINTVLEAPGSGPVLFLSSTIVSASFSVEGLTLQNGIGRAGGGGLYIGTSGGTAIIDNCSIYNNSSTTLGGGLHISAAKISISNSNISDNNGYNGGGSIFGGEFTMNNTTIAHNRGSKGGGLLISSNKVVLADNVISSNYAGVDGGGVYIENGLVTLRGNDISHNDTQFDGGGINILGASSVEMINNSVTYNRSIQIGGGHGGGVAIRDVPTVTITDNNISYNSNGNDGGGIFILEFNKCTLNNNVIEHNIGGPGAGAFIKEWGSSAAFSEVDLINNTFCFNVTSGNSLRGGGIYVSLNADTSTANIYNNIT